MPPEAYEQIIPNVGQPLRESDGFISHAAEITPDGVTVKVNYIDPQTK